MLETKKQNAGFFSRQLKGLYVFFAIKYHLMDIDKMVKKLDTIDNVSSHDTENISVGNFINSAILTEPKTETYNSNLSCSSHPTNIVSTFRSRQMLRNVPNCFSTAYHTIGNNQMSIPGVSSARQAKDISARRVTSQHSDDFERRSMDSLEPQIRFRIRRATNCSNNAEV